ncbi:MAG: glutamate synthase large subunit [Prevotellaceae bacterium]|jgi:glutamate synthase (NADPH/NADH) large chain|nr:glutamate synthase large subunit [Prevotellaceae bacterium]
MEGKSLYESGFEHDSCGVGIVANIKGDKSHDIVEKALQILENMLHRGAESSDNKTGDGAGITVQIPHEFTLLQGIPVPAQGKYGTGILFLPKDKKLSILCLDIIKELLDSEGLSLLKVRDVPVNPDILGEISRNSEPDIKQIYVVSKENQRNLETRLYVARKKIEKRIKTLSSVGTHDFYVVSLSSRRLTYKGMLTSTQLREYFLDLSNPYFTSGLALVHSRFSTNTLPTWDLAQPFRLLGHNGEINTIRGNRHWMQARESVLKAPGLEDVFPIVQDSMSDSASLDNVLEYFVMAGKSLPNALSMLVPESWNEKNPISNELKAYYEYHSLVMEPWDGPATLLFTDGRYAGGMLDRNGLRPARYLITKDDTIVIASEAGVLPFAAGDVKEKGRLRPGKMLMIDTLEGKIYYDSDLKEKLAAAYPYREWLAKNRIMLSDISSGRVVKHRVNNHQKFLHAFGYTKEDIERIIIPMATDAKEPVGSMGNDTPLAVLSEKPQLLYSYFRQLFAQVTNPPIDPIREELVMSLSLYIGRQDGNFLEPLPDLCKMVKLHTPVIGNDELDLLANLGYKGFRALSLPMVFDVKKGYKGMETALDDLCRQAEQAVDDGYNYVILSDRSVDANRAAIPSLLAVSTVHHYLIGKQKRMQIVIVAETADAREVMHFALLFGFGATAINPYMALSVIDELTSRGEIRNDYHTAEQKYIKSIHKGLLKIMSKMGISTLRSYRGAQIFEAAGLSQDFLNKYFKGMNSKIGGIGLEEITNDTLARHSAAFGTEIESNYLVNSGTYAYRRNGENHAWNPETISKLQIATRTGDYAKFKEFTNIVDNKLSPIFLRDFLTYRKNPTGAIDISKVEPVENIMKYFVSGAMSFGSISKEAHEALAVALNAIKGKSNTGEGGEDPVRFVVGEDGLNKRSAIKQIASGRFGVTAEYLVNADEIQIKIAQGAKPGEGGQLPGYKVNKIIAATRHSIPGISLISPPPHHDIYSIEDLAQLIFDLKNVNPSARISVKLVSETGVGTIAAGVAKAKADVIVISGCEGGTGASPISSIFRAGMPGELGLAETQQILVANDLRKYIRLQTDGQLKTGKDIIISALLGAEEFGFATSALIVLGCVMMRKCHMNTCPVGVATQDAELRKRFSGKHEYLVNFFTFLATEVREHLAVMGFRSLNEIVGRADLIERIEKGNAKAAKLDFSKLLYYDKNLKNDLKFTTPQEHRIGNVIDISLIDKAKQALIQLKPVYHETTIANTNRAVGTMLAGEVAKLYGNTGMPDETIRIVFKGSAGQSFGAFLPTGITFRLEGEANDYLGKGLSGGRIILLPPSGSTFEPDKNIIAGNTLLYGATSGEVYISGVVGERFCVRNSGATAVVEGSGDHCCEYMTGGRVVVLGSCGKNFAAGMSGGIAYVLNMNDDFDYFCNMEMVELSLVEDKADNEELRLLISAHEKYTQSPVAKRILNEWDNYVKRFIKVLPIEYKKVLHEEKMEALTKKLEQVEHDY